jgi:hypothetical protein
VPSGLNGKLVQLQSPPLEWLTGYGFHGVFCECRMCDRVLTLPEILDICHRSIDDSVILGSNNSRTGKSLIHAPLAIQTNDDGNSFSVGYSIVPNYCFVWTFPVIPTTTAVEWETRVISHRNVWSLIIPQILCWSHPATGCISPVNLKPTGYIIRTVTAPASLRRSTLEWKYGLLWFNWTRNTFTSLPHCLPL